MKPVLEEECFFMRMVPAGLIARTQARGAVRLRRIAKEFCLFGINVFVVRP
jgi:hypothetical protein